MRGIPVHAMGVTAEHLAAAPRAARLIEAVRSGEGCDPDTEWAAWSDAWDHVFGQRDMTEARVKLWLVACGLEGK